MSDEFKILYEQFKRLCHVLVNKQIITTMDLYYVVHGKVGDISDQM